MKHYTRITVRHKTLGEAVSYMVSEFMEEIIAYVEKFMRNEYEVAVEFINENEFNAACSRV